jgi:PilZ domain
MRLPGKTDEIMNKDQRLHTQGASTERRTSSRTAIHRPAYINFEPYNRGGIITDISETGLGFHTVDVLDQGGIVRVSILLGAAKQIEAVGELIWKDATCRVGGLRFTVLPPGAADQIRDWAEASNSTNPSNADISEAGGSPRTTMTQEGLISNTTSPRSETLSATENEVIKSNHEPKLTEPPQPIAPQTPIPGASTRTPWVPPSMRPASSAPSTPTGLPHSLSTGTPPSTAQPWLPPAAYQQPSPMPWITHFDPDPPSGKWAFVRGVLGGVIICLLLAGAGWFAAGHYAGNGSAFPFRNPFASHPVESSPVAPRPDLPSADIPDVTNNSNPANSLPSKQSQPAPSRESSSPASPDVQPNTQSNLNPRPTSNPASHLAPDSSAAPETKSARASTLPQSTVAQEPAAAAAPPDTLSAARGSLSAVPPPAAAPPARAPDAGESQLTLARQYLDGRSRPRNPAAASQLLWSAVEKGNSVAEMDLADLYMRGDGVARNCDQARVLLSAASGKGNAEAMQKLSELNRTGCR